MIIHLDSNNPKPIEQKVKNLILKKLYIKVRDEHIFINKEDFISLILNDIVILAQTKRNIDAALKVAIKLQPEYKANPLIRRNELEEALDEFKVEILAYEFFLDDKENGVSDDDLYDGVLDVLNSEHDLLERKLHELMILALDKRIEDEDTNNSNISKEQLIDVLANQVKLIASYDDIDEAVDAAIEEFTNQSIKSRLKKEAIKKDFERFSLIAKDEIAAYRLALNFREQNAEFPMILATVRQVLNLE